MLPDAYVENESDVTGPEVSDSCKDALDALSQPSIQQAEVSLMGTDHQVLWNPSSQTHCMVADVNLGEAFQTLHFACAETLNMQPRSYSVCCTMSTADNGNPLQYVCQLHSSR